MIPVMPMWIGLDFLSNHGNILRPGNLKLISVTQIYIINKLT